MERTLQDIAELSWKHRNIAKVLLFGSRARGTHSRTSDYDLAVYTKSGKSSDISLFLQDLEEMDCLCKIDIVRISERTDPILLENIQKEGVVLMKRSTKVENFTKAVARLEEAVSLCREESNAIYFDALIQRFEFSTELAWKTCKEHLEELGYSDVNGPKPVMREAFSAGLIQEADIWIGILTDRNRTSHIYDEDTAREIGEHIIHSYLPEFQKLLGYFQKFQSQ